MASKRNQAGFFTIDALFGLMVLAIMLSLAGWWMFSFSNPLHGRMFMYPLEWSAEEKPHTSPTF